MRVRRVISVVVSANSQVAVSEVATGRDSHVDAAANCCKIPQGTAPCEGCGCPPRPLADSVGCWSSPESYRREPQGCCGVVRRVLRREGRVDCSLSPPMLCGRLSLPRPVHVYRPKGRTFVPLSVWAYDYAHWGTMRRVGRGATHRDGYGEVANRLLHVVLSAAGRRVVQPRAHL